MTITRRGLTYLFVLCLVLCLGWLAYAPALNGRLLLDDVSNLGGLAKIEDFRSALLFIFSGDAGPLGRPVALASFALQADAWGGSARPFILVNILVHLLNAGLLSWALYRLAVLSRVPEHGRAFAAIAAAAIWLFMPLLASASLMVIQRMTTLSATFVLLGLAGYLHARTDLERSSRRSLVLMSACLVIATALAAFTKESGALLPVYVLVLEATVLTRPAGLGARWAIWKTAFLVLPAAAIAAYIAVRVPYGPSTVLSRDFTGWERLITEAGILWQYLFNALVPRPGVFGPFHDGYPVARTVFDPFALAAIVAWIALAGMAIFLRRARPFFALAVLWFLAGHAIESTLVPLELYFEHRNYLPVVGPLFALCAALTHVRSEHRRLVVAGITAYALVNAAVLFSNTSLWGNPPLAAVYWQQKFPDSVRAATNVAEYRLRTEGPRGALQTLRSIVDRNPSKAYLLIPALSLSCIAAPQAEHARELDELSQLLPRTDFSYTVGTMLSDLYTTARKVDCRGVSGAAVMNLAKVLMENPRYSGNGGYKRLHHQLLARVLRDEGEYAQAIAHLEHALEFGRGADLNMMIVTTYADAKDYEAAREHIAAARHNPPRNPLRRFVWESGLDELQKYVAILDSANGTAGSGVKVQ